MLAPFAPISFGPDGAVEDEQGKMLSIIKIIIRSHVKRTLLLRLLLRRSPPDAVFASLGGRAVSLPVARGNASVRLVLEFVAILTNSIVVFLSVVVRCLPPAAAAEGW